MVGHPIRAMDEVASAESRDGKYQSVCRKMRYKPMVIAFFGHRMTRTKPHCAIACARQAGHTASKESIQMT